MVVLRLVGARVEKEEGHEQPVMTTNEPVQLLGQSLLPHQLFLLLHRGAVARPDLHRKLQLIRVERQQTHGQACRKSGHEHLEGHMQTYMHLYAYTCVKSV